MGGAGGLLEIQKILPQLNGRGETAFLLIQDMDTSIASPFCNYFNSCCHLNVLPLEDGMPILSGNCLVTDWSNRARLEETEQGLVARVDRKERLEPEALLVDAARLLGPGCALFLLSGVDLDMGKGLKELVGKAGRILLQRPETCLDPDPIQELKAMELEDGEFEPEKILEPLNAWFQATDRI